MTDPDIETWLLRRGFRIVGQDPDLWEVYPQRALNGLWAWDERTECRSYKEAIVVAVEQAMQAERRKEIK